MATTNHKAQRTAANANNIATTTTTPPHVPRIAPQAIIAAASAARNNNNNNHHMGAPIIQQHWLGGVGTARMLGLRLGILRSPSQLPPAAAATAVVPAVVDNNNNNNDNSNSKNTSGRNKRARREELEEILKKAEEAKRQRQEEKEKQKAEYKAKGLTQKGLPRKKSKRKDVTPHITGLYDELSTLQRTSLQKATEAHEEAKRQLMEAQAKVDEAQVQLDNVKKDESKLHDLLYDAEMKLENDFTRMYHRFVTYQKEHGKCSVVSDDPELADFISKMRKKKSAHDKGRMGSETWRGIPTRYQIRALDSVGFVWNSVSDQWQTQFDKMVAFRNENGHCCVPKAYGPDMPLGAWVHRQRYFYRLFHEGKPNQLTQERIDLLNSVGFSWSGSSSTPIEETISPLQTKPRNGGEKIDADEEWENLFLQAVQFKETFGHLSFGKSEDRESRNNRLRDWASWQRKQYRLYKNEQPSHLCDDKVRRLDEIGFVWRPVGGCGTTSARKEKE